MVDAGAAARMNSLVTLGMDRNGLLRDGLRVHGGMVYPSIQALSADKAREGAVAVALGYDHIPELHYKHDMSLDNRKPSNGYVGLYKNPLPGCPGGLLGLDRRVGPAEKHSDLGLNGGSAYLRLPWVSPYPEAGMYSYLDKYALYKASFLSQPTPQYLPQHLAYQSLCAGAGGASAERLFYMPPYPPAPISSPLAPPLRIPTATVAPAALSPLVHCQDKGMQSLGPRIHHEPPSPASAFGQQLHHQTHVERSHAERPHGNRSHAERPYADRSQGERPHGERPHSDRSHGDRCHGERSHSDRSHGERPYGDRSHGERPHSDRSIGDRPHSDRSIGDRPHSDRAHGERPHSDRSHGDRPHSDRAHGERSHGDRSHSERSHSSTKSGRNPSSGSSLPPDSTPSLLMPSPRTPVRLSQPPALPPSLSDSTLDFQKPLHRVLPHPHPPPPPH